MRFKVRIEKEVEATVLQVRGKVSDACTYTLTDDKGLEIVEHDGYIPSWLSRSMQCDGDSDHLFFDVDLKTGQIIGWKPPSDHEIQVWVRGIQDGDE